ncbi:MAG: RNA polymerase sigma factor [Bacteroidales bacterium]
MNDKELVLSVKNGNTHAFRFLVEQNKNLVWHMVLRLVKQNEDAEDICQEVFMRVFRDIARFRGESKLSTWIASVTYNICIDHLRKKGREKLDFTAEPGKMELSRPEFSTPLQKLNQEDLRKMVVRLIDQMPLHYRSVMTLFHLEEMSYKEIGEITGMPEGTIKSYLNRGREIIKDQVLKVIPDIHPVLFETDLY